MKRIPIYLSWSKHSPQDMIFWTSILTTADESSIAMYLMSVLRLPSPTDADKFTFERFSKMLADRKEIMKTVLVGKAAVVVGLGNSAYQDILYRAKIHPKTRASELGKNEKRALYDAVKSVVEERIRLGGNDEFSDLYGKQGRYVAMVGSHVKTCANCGTPIERLSIGGGQTYFGPKCQR